MLVATNSELRQIAIKIMAEEPSEDSAKILTCLNMIAILPINDEVKNGPLQVAQRIKP